MHIYVGNQHQLHRKNCVRKCHVPPKSLNQQTHHLRSPLVEFDIVCNQDDMFVADVTLWSPRLLCRNEWVNNKVSGKMILVSRNKVNIMHAVKLVWFLFLECPYWGCCNSQIWEKVRQERHEDMFLSFRERMRKPKTKCTRKSTESR